jgi:periplasmic protein TonB
MKYYFLIFSLLAGSFCAVAQTTAPPSVINTGDSNVVFNKVESEASFPGGEAGWRTFLEKTLVPDNAQEAVPKRKKKFVETVIIKFIVSKEGRLLEIAAENKVHPAIAAEAIRVMKKSPLWIPAMQDGKPVNAYRRQPITFAFY